MGDLVMAAAAAATVLGAVGSWSPGGTAVAPPCDRACMVGLTDRYFVALAAHDPKGLPLSRGVKFTENAAEIPVGSGLWVGASEAPTSFRIYAVDLDSGQVGFYGVMKEWGRPLIIALRLKVVNGQITEIEHVLARGIRGDAALANLVTPRPEFVADLKPEERTPRQQMVNIADSYFEAIEHADGKLAPFEEDCVRHENGAQTTKNPTPVPWPVPLGSPEADRGMAILGTLSCEKQFDSHVMDFITRLWPRRHEVVDEEKGLVFSFPMFQHRGGSGTIRIVGVPGVESLPLGGGTSNLQAGEIFRIRSGKIQSIEAMGASLPYGTKSPWD